MTEMTLDDWLRENNMLESDGTPLSLEVLEHLKEFDNSVNPFSGLKPSVILGLLRGLNFYFYEMDNYLEIKIHDSYGYTEYIASKKGVLYKLSFNLCDYRLFSANHYISKKEKTNTIRLNIIDKSSRKTETDINFDLTSGLFHETNLKDRKNSITEEQKNNLIEHLKIATKLAKSINKEKTNVYKIKRKSKNL